MAAPETFIGKTIGVGGWIRTMRSGGGGSFFFVKLYDGTTADEIQIIVDAQCKGFKDIEKCGNGTSIFAVGDVIASPAKGQKVEMKATEVRILGQSDPVSYPLAGKNLTLEYYRSVQHFRPRSMVMGAVSRIRNTLAFATHEFFQNEGFQYVHTPLITCSDCEGAGEMFQVTTLIKGDDFSAKTPQGKPDYAKDFFKKPAFLTVSGQLNAEIYATALSSVYTFGPTFRAEQSMTRRHLSEFWMIEPEIAFADLQENMCIAESYLKFVMDAALKRNPADMKVLEDFETASHKEIPEDEKKAMALTKQPHWRALPLRQRLQNIIDVKFARVTYTEAIAILEKAVAGGHKFEEAVSWGIDMGSEHERYLCEVHFRKPTIVTDYPKAIKAFYMRENDDKKTVAAMDVLVPGVGELIGGSQREERYDNLVARIIEAKLNPEDYSWYLDLRKYGTVPHSGFGAGFERLVCYTTGIDNIRDAIPFPRYPGHADF